MPRCTRLFISLLLVKVKAQTKKKSVFTLIKYRDFALLLRVNKFFLRFFLILACKYYVT